MTKVVNQDKAISRRQRLKVRCGACIGLKKKLQGFEAPCSQQGKHGSSPSCDSFTPNYSHVRTSNPQLIQDVGLLLKDMPEHVKHLVAYSIINSTEMMRVTKSMLGVALKMSHPVAVNLSAPREDYVNCWFSGFAMGITPNKDSLIICSKVKDNWVHVIMPFNSESIMTAVQWREHKKTLIKAKRINAKNKVLESILPTLKPSEVKKDNFIPQKIYKSPEVLQKRVRGSNADTSYKVKATKKGKIITI